MKYWRWILLALLGLIVCLFLIRLVLPSQIDDVTPGIPCEDYLLEKSDVLYVIPLFENKSIAEDREWCEKTLSLDKELAMHGVYHTWKEFDENRDAEYLQRGIEEFEKCFGFAPERFKPSQIIISDSNARLVLNSMELDLRWNQIFHKVYHCNDSGLYPNWLIGIF